MFCHRLTGASASAALSFLLASSLVCLSGQPALAQQQPAPKKPASGKPASGKPAQGNKVKGQAQLAGANGKFGEVYSLKNGVNYAILGARYALSTHPSYARSGSLYPATEEKLLLVQVAIKNATAQDLDYWGELVSVVDQEGKVYQSEDGAYSLNGNPNPTGYFTLRPGQGLGQAGSSSGPLTLGVHVPARSRIVKIMVNQGRLNTSEEVVRYYVAGATKAEAGEEGDPENKIAPLPEEARDPADPTGATALPAGKAKLGQFYPTGDFAFRLDSLTYSTDAIYDQNPPEEGKKYAIATVTVKNLSQKTLGAGFTWGGNLTEVVDAEGERALMHGYRATTRDQDPDREFKPGDQYVIRFFFIIPAEATVKQLYLAAQDARRWEYEL